VSPKRLHEFWKAVIYWYAFIFLIILTGHDSNNPSLMGSQKTAKEKIKEPQSLSPLLHGAAKIVC
jgi:hypothetical protein